MRGEKIVFTNPNNDSAKSYNHPFFIRLLSNSLITLSINFIFYVFVIVLYEMSTNHLSVFRALTAIAAIAVLVIVFSTVSNYDSNGFVY